MGWHDAKVWGMLANPSKWEYLFDLDYIFQWVQLEGGEEYYQFWMAPVTMVFENAYDVKINIQSPQGEIEVADLYMEDALKTENGEHTEHTFRFVCQEGEITLRATGYKMYVRNNPMLCQSQSIGYQERGGVNFGRELNAL